MSSDQTSDQIDEVAPYEPLDLDSGKSVHSVVKAIEIMRFLARKGDSVGVSEISRELRINLSTCFNILRTLAKLDLVQFEPSSKSYKLGHGVLDLARGFVVSRKNVVEVVRPELEAIARKYGVTVTLWRRISGDRMMLFSSFESRELMSIHMGIGSRLPLYGGAMGRLLAAHSGLDRETLKKEFEKLRWSGPLDFFSYAADVERAKAAGWAMDSGTFVKGATTISAPVFDRDGKVSIVVSAAMFSGQHAQETMDEIVESLKAVASRMTSYLLEL